VSSTAPGHATFYRPAEVATMLRCSEWWIKEQARKRRIPYSWIGGSYLFTDAHIAEIVRLFEVKPEETVVSIPTPRSPRRNADPATEPAHRLSARVPRRARAAAENAAA
jgi:hypothetical protein